MSPCRAVLTWYVLGVAFGALVTLALCNEALRRLETERAKRRREEKTALIEETLFLLRDSARQPVIEYELSGSRN